MQTPEYGSLEERFWPNVDKQGLIPTDPSLGRCWDWKAGTSGGYGILRLSGGPPIRAHQVSWRLAGREPVPPGLVIRHRCDNRLCVNPDHLCLGTRAENNQDTHDRHRWTYVPAGKGKRRGPPRRKGPAPRPIEERFWPKVDKNGPVPEHDPSLGPCWLWISTLFRQGYGSFFLPGSHRNASKAKAHRVAYELVVGPIPEGRSVLHRCGVRRCVNPAHLYLGNDADNARDRREHGREPDRRGAKNGRAKLTAEQVAEIRRRYTGAWGQQTALAREYGVWQTTISGIVRGVKWKVPADG